MVDQKRQPYCSYLLRLWRPNPFSRSVWYASLENVQTGDTVYFVNLNALLVFLERQTAIAEDRYEEEVLRWLLSDW